MQDRLYYFKIPDHAATWYKANCCPACGRVNQTGKLCDVVNVCLNCGTKQCSGNGRCVLCYGYLSGFWKAEENHKKWLKEQERKQRRAKK